MKWLKFLEKLDKQRSAVRAVPSFQKASIPADHPILKDLIALVDDAMQEYEAPGTITVTLDDDGNLIIPEGMRAQGVNTEQSSKGTVYSQRIDKGTNIVPKGGAVPQAVMLPRQDDVKHVNRAPDLSDATEDTVAK